ncbi:Ig-like domain (group 3) [Actinacidiphila yanglinensis]|uniref:Ig-like domain (Group 3) n=1 Tax=Actinacidiphila yanglinensis TaxID=310779 RepID=A0A1H6AWV1_9ACTN|nr:Ig-like domain-containing protein [Actinacidiphila yanglinensis]SEG52547.1 Ig-like domain (group 3) [Actinacidiphila yanglinensis]
MIPWRERRVRRARREHKAAFLVAAAAAAAVVALAPSAAAVDTSSTTVEASPSSATTGRLVVLDATVTCTSDPSTGLGVSFFDGDNLLATAPVSTDGQSFLTTGFTTTGTHIITATFNGDAGCGASHATTDVTVSRAAAPPSNNPGCLLCGLIDYHVGDIHNEININSHNTTNIGMPSARW